MSTMPPTNSTEPTSLPPGLQEILTIISPSVDTLILNTMFCAFLVPVAIALLVTSTHKWKTLIFSMNIAAIGLGFAFGAFDIYFQRAIINLRPIDPKLAMVDACLYFFIPICTQSILLIRVVAVYPPREATWRQNIMIYGTFGALITARLANAIVDFVHTGRLVDHASDASAIWTADWKLPYVKVEFVLQLSHNVLASILFLSRLHDGGALRTHSGTHVSIFTSGGKSSYTARLKGLFWIATFNFVFPVILNIIMIIFVFRDSNITHLADAMVANVFVDIICVILATVWCSGTYWQNPTLVGLGTSGPVRFAEEATVDSLASATFAPPPAHVQFGMEMSKINK